MARQKPIQSFEQLSQVLGALHLEIPELPPELLQDLSQLDKAVDEKFKMIQQIERTVSEALNWLTSAELWVAMCEPAMRRRVARQTISPHRAKVEQYVDNCLHVEEPLYRTVAATAYLNFQFGKEVNTNEDAESILKDLQDKGILVKQPGGQILIGYQRYNVSDRFGLEKEDLEKVQETLERFSRTYMQIVSENRRAQTSQMNAAVDLNFDQFVEGTVGKFLLVVPAESYEDEDGKEKWRAGGNLLVENNGREVVPIEASGAIERMVANLVSLEVKIPHFMLKWETPPGHGKEAFATVKTGVMKSLRLTEQDAEIYVKKMQAFWYILVRGIDAVLRARLTQELKEKLIPLATITPENFFGLNGNPPMDGIAYLEFAETFKFKGKNISDVFLLVESTTVEGIRNIRVVEVPDHLREILGDLSFQANPEGENFEMLPPNLGKILRAIRSKTDLKTEIAKG